MEQLPLPLELPDNPTVTDSIEDLSRGSFSHDEVSPQGERLALEKRYAALLEEARRFSRQLVSFQGNKDALLHSWFKYREGFSAQLVESLVLQLGIEHGDTILDPFSGSGTTLLVAKAKGINAVGIEILPVCHLAWDAKARVFDYELDELKRVYNLIVQAKPGRVTTPFPHIPITESAFPPDIESSLMFYTEWVETIEVSEAIRLLLRLLLTSILEDISYTRKDGQYLRWDRRSEKIRRRNEIRLSQGKRPIRGMDKGALPSVKKAFVASLAAVIDDIKRLQQLTFRESCQQLIKGSALEVLPTLEADQFDGVITSPPYCNRYDYTRTYALELAYLGVGKQEIRDLRQSQLSCTVENRSKVSSLEDYYGSLGQLDRYKQVLSVVQQNAVLKEINHALQLRWERGEINNKGILPMVEGYFTELAFVFAEIFRTCRSGAHVAFVNDNVRYGGEVIPVDLLCTELAERLGFEPVKIYVLPQRKGNSSQQMGRYGREGLRKSITIWRKA